jgi:hypothetical protein
VREFLLCRVRAALKPKNKELQGKLDELSDFFLQSSRPKVFAPWEEDSVLRRSDEQFEEMLNTMEDAGHEARGLTEFAYYHKINFLQKKNQPKEPKF